MQSITNRSELREAIEQLKIKREFKAVALKEQFVSTYESFRPVNLLKSSLKDIASSTGLIKYVLGATMAMGAGLLAKKGAENESGNTFKKLLDFIVHQGITAVVKQNPDRIKSFVQHMLEYLFKKN